MNTPNGVAGPSLFNSWAKDEEGNYKDLTGQDLNAILGSISKNPKAYQGIMQATADHVKSGYKSSGDFRKDATVGIAELMNLFQRKDNAR